MSVRGSQQSTTRIAVIALALLLLLLLVLLAYFFIVRPGEQCSDAPTLTVNNPAVTVDEDQTAENTGTFDHGQNCGPVRFEEPDVGSVAPTGAESGT